MASHRDVQVVCGLSGSGKTAAALDRFSAQVQEQGEDCALLILPTARVVRQARERLVSGGVVPGLLDPRIFTFPQLAQLILNANHECAAALGASARRLLLRETAQALVASGEVAELAEVSRRPGFTTALGELIADLKRAAVQPERFAEALRRAGLEGPTHREIATLYSAYQETLVDLGYYDEEGLFWLARDVLRSDRRRPLQRVELMVVDGFTDFTTTQLDMLETLAAGIPQALITLDHSPDDDREGLAPWFSDTLARLERRLGPLRLTRLGPDAQDGPLAHLRANLFAPGAARQVSAEGRVHLLSCPDRARETREVLARVKSLLLSGEARPREVAIVARDLAERAPEIEHLAGRLGVPVHVDTRRSPVDSPAVRAVLHAYEAVMGGYRRDDVLGLIRSTCFTFEALSGLGDDAVAWAAEQAKVVEGRRQWSERLQRLAQRLARSRDEETRARAPAVEAIASAMEHLFALLPDPRSERTPAERVTELRTFIAATDVWRNVARPTLAEHASANLRALADLERALDELEHVRAGPAGEAALPLAAFHRLLGDLLADLADLPPPPAGDRVCVLDARQARQARFAVTFVIGLCEGDFPRRPREEPFFSAGELAQLEGAGVVLERRRGPEAAEPLLFYGAVASAERDLWLTRPFADAEGKPLQASHYLREVRRLFQEATLDSVDVPFSEVVPRVAAVAEPLELAARAMFDLAAPPRDASAVAYNALAGSEVGRALLPRLARGLALEELRDSLRPSGPYVGEFVETALVADLAQAFGASRRFSPTDLDTYAACPFSYLCQCVLGLTEPEYASATVDARTAGEVRHSILAAFTARRLEQRPGQALIAPGEEPAASEELDGILRDAFAAAVRRGEVADEALWQIEGERCRRELYAWVEAEASTFADQRPARVEYRFGREGEPPAALPQRADILLNGRIDRLDLGAAGYSLIDYKSGALPRPKAVTEGLDLQFPIYSLGAEQTLPELAGAACAGWHFVGLRRPPSLVSFTKPEEIEALREAIEGRIAELVDAIRAGRFGYIDVEQCFRQCPASRICRHQPRRRETGSDETEYDDPA